MPIARGSEYRTLASLEKANLIVRSDGVLALAGK